MRIYATINERTVRRTFREQKIGRNGLTVIDRDLPAFALKVSKSGTRKFIVNVVRKLGRSTIDLGGADDITAEEAREKAIAAIADAKGERETGPLFADFAQEFLRRQGQRWKPSTRKGNAALVDKFLLPFFGAMHVAKIDRADVRRWFDSLNGTPGNANRTLPVLSVMMRQAELWDIRPQGSNPCRNMRRYRMAPRERFLSVDELKRLGAVLQDSDDLQTVAAVRLLLFTGARSSEITGLQWDWIRSTRAVLPDSKTGPKAIQLPPPAQAVLAGLPRTGCFVFPNRNNDGPMTGFGQRWEKLRGLADLDDVRIHDLRHTFASHAVMSGLDLYTVGRLLGHADTASTERYAHLADEHVREAAGRISGIVHDAMTGKEEEHAR